MPAHISPRTAVRTGREGGRREPGAGGKGEGGTRCSLTLFETQTEEAKVPGGNDSLSPAALLGRGSVLGRCRTGPSVSPGLRYTGTPRRHKVDVATKRVSQSSESRAFFFGFPVHIKMR